MPSGKDVTGGGSAGKRNGGGNSPTGTTTGGAKKNAYCSFCRKSYRDVGPLVEGPGDVYICGECIELCQSILDQERRRRGVPKPLFTDIPTPARDQGRSSTQYVIGQDRAKKVLVRRRPQPLQAAGRTARTPTATSRSTSRTSC